MPFRVSWFLFMLIITQFFLLGCESRPKWEHFQGGIHLVLEVESMGNPTVDKENTAKIAEILNERVRTLGIRRKIVRIRGERGIVVQLPKSKNPDRLIELVSKSAYLEFKLVDESQAAQVLKLMEAIEDSDDAQKVYANFDIPVGCKVYYSRRVDPITGQVSRTAYLLKDRPLLTGEYLTNAEVRIDTQYNRPYVSLSFDDRGGKLFEKITGENVKKRLAIVLDGNVYSAPVIQDRISGGNAVIEGQFTMDEAKDLAVVLRAGAYPVPTRVIESKKLTRTIWLGNTE